MKNYLRLSILAALPVSLLMFQSIVTTKDRKPTEQPLIEKAAFRGPASVFGETN